MMRDDDLERLLAEELASVGFGTAIGDTLRTGRMLPLPEELFRFYKASERAMRKAYVLGLNAATFGNAKGGDAIKPGTVADILRAAQGEGHGS